VLRNLIDKLFLGGYEAADRDSAARVVARYTRGNTSIQFRRYLTDKKLERLRTDGDRAAGRLARRAERASI
jgi:hypothetical protein